MNLKNQRLRKSVTITSPIELNIQFPLINNKIIRYYQASIQVGEIARRLSLAYKSTITILEIYLTLYKALPDTALSPRLIQRKITDPHEIRIISFPRIYELWINGATPNIIYGALYTENKKAISSIITALRNRARSNNSIRHHMETEDLLLCLQQAQRITHNSEDGIFIPLTAIPPTVLEELNIELFNNKNGDLEVTQESVDILEAKIRNTNEQAINNIARVHQQKAPKEYKSLRKKNILKNTVKEDETLSKQEILEEDEEYITELEKEEVYVEQIVSNGNKDDNIQEQLLTEEQKEDKINDLLT